MLFYSISQLSTLAAFLSGISALDLLSKTPGFVHTAIETRLEGYFEGVYRYAEQHFGGDNLYMQALLHNCSFLEAVLAQDDLDLLAQSLG